MPTIYTLTNRRSLPANLRLLLGIPVLLLSLTLVGCGGSSGGGIIDEDDDGGADDTGGGGGPGARSGIFVDAFVANLDFLTNTVSGVTANDGEFTYNDGEPIAFSIGGPAGIPLGTAPGADIITPVQLVPGAENAEANAVTNIVRLLLTLDTNQNPNDGTQIPENARTIAANTTPPFNINFNQSPNDFGSDSEVQRFINAVYPPDSSRMLITAEAAQDHLTASLSAQFGTPIAQDISFDDIPNAAPFNGNATATDPQGDFLTYTALSNPTNGTLAFNGDGSFTYTPETGFIGTDSFTFFADDNANDDLRSNTATITLNVISSAFTRAVEITDPADLIGGPMARATVCSQTPGPGDLPGCDVLLENDQIRVIIQREGRQWYNIGVYGGTIIDADLQRGPGESGRDHFEEFFLGVNIETASNPETVIVTDAGGTADTDVAEVCAEGPDDLHDFVNGSSAIRDLGFNFPSSADDVDLPVTIRTCYRLMPGVNYVEIETTIMNESTSDQNIYLTEWFSGSGEVELFQPGLGMGEPFVSPSCPANALQCSSEGDGCESCNWLSYAGHEGGNGVSYGYIHNEPGTTSVSISGVSILLLGEDIVNVAIPPGTAGPPNYTVPASGELSNTRYFVVGDGNVNSVQEARNEIFGVVQGEITGTVTDSSGPVADAEIAVIGAPYTSPGLHNSGPDVNVVSHFRTDANGQYGGMLPIGDYTLRINKPGRLASPEDNAAISITDGGSITQNFTLPPQSTIEITVVDENGSPIPAKVQLVGFDLGPAPATGANSQAIAGGLLTAETGVFGDRGADPVSFGVAFTEYTRHQDGTFGDSTNNPTAFDMTPGTYDLVVSHGPRYSSFRQNDVVITEGVNNLGQVQLTQVIPTPEYLHGDFHVHGLDSPDSEVTNIERVMSYLSADMDYFASADHGRRIDFRPIISSLGADLLLGASVGSENTTFDFGHINVYPAVLEPEFISGGSIDWGREAPVGEDFPVPFNNYVKSPAEIFAEGKSDRLAVADDDNDVTVQINHIEGHFGPNGLRIDTGQTPPRSSTVPEMTTFQTMNERKRIDPAIGNIFDEGFDALELWISADGDLYQDETIGHLFVENFGDWANMINQGIIKTAMANSDTHQRRESSLYVRNLIANPNGLTPADMNTDAGAIEATNHINDGRTISTNGPILNVSIANQGGVVASLMPGDPGWKGGPLPVPLTTGTADLTVRIRAADWVPFDRLRVFVNPFTRQADFTVTDPPRYSLCPAAIDMPLDDTPNMSHPVTGAEYFDDEFNISLTSELPDGDAWVFVLVTATEGVSEPLFPIAPEALSDSAGDGNDTLDELRTNIGEEGIVSLAYSNPLFIDRDGNGQFDPPGVQTLIPTPPGLPPPPGPPFGCP